GDTSERAFGDVESDDQAVAIDRNALQDLNIRFAITEIVHESLDCAAVLFQQRQARITTTVTEPWNQADGVGLLSLETALDVCERQLVRAGDANVAQMKSTALLDFILDRDVVPG